MSIAGRPGRCVEEGIKVVKEKIGGQEIPRRPDGRPRDLHQRLEVMQAGPAAVLKKLASGLTT